MEVRRAFEPFGQVDIPPLSDSELTASYNAVEWIRVRQFWNITMYQTVPSSGEPVEMSSAVLTLPQFQELNGDWNEVMEEVLHNRAELWERLASR